MSRLAGKLPSPDEVRTRIRKGPVGACDVYGDGDMDDWREVENLRRATCWNDAQREVDTVLGLENPIATNAFRYHFSRKCGHWTEAQRRETL